MGRKDNGISTRNWTLIWVLGLAGQLCWNVENQWFNTFVYNKIGPFPEIVAWMVGVSAAVTTISTFVFGTWSDRKGKRKPFLVWGYILWALFTVLFGLGEYLPKSPLTLVVIFCVGTDAIMSFFGSMANDSAFSAWTTDISSEKNRGQLGAVFAAMPVIATIIGTVVSGMIIDALDFMPFFVIMGVIVAGAGVIASVFLKEKGVEPNIDEKGFWHQFIGVFNFRTVKKNKELFWVFCIMMVYFIGFNIYYPYLTVYFVNYLGMDYTNAGIIQGVGLLVAVGLSFAVASQVNKNKNSLIIGASIVLNILGMVVIIFSKKTVGLMIGTLLAGIGYVFILQTLTAWMKNLYPEDSRGQFEGVKIVFFVCIPMIIAPLISTQIIYNFGTKMVIDGVEGMGPNENLLVAAAIEMVLTILPLIPASRLLKSRLAKKNIEG